MLEKKISAYPPTNVGVSHRVKSISPVRKKSRDMTLGWRSKRYCPRVERVGGEGGEKGF